jgi:hypothetical protein
MNTLAPATSLVMRSVPVVGVAATAGAAGVAVAGDVPLAPREVAVLRDGSADRAGGAAGDGAGETGFAALAGADGGGSGRALSPPLQNARPAIAPTTSRPPAAMAMRRPGIGSRQV